MASTVTCIEEIPRSELKVPQIRLKIISLNLNDRGESLTPPPPPAARGGGDEECGGALQPYNPPAVVRKQLHKLQSYDHLLHDLQKSYRRKAGYSYRQRSSAPMDKPTFDNPSGRSSDKNHNSEADNSEQQFPDNDDHTYVVFVKGMSNFMCGDREKILSTLAHLLNKHVASVAMKEYKLLGNGRSRSPKSTLNHALVQGALLALSEILDQGVLDISRMGMVQAGQCLSFTLFFHKNVQKLGREAWHSAFAQLIRDAWMSFGCVGAMVFLSSMRH